VIDGGGILVAPLLFALELAVLYVTGSNMMNHLMGISGFDGNGSVLGRIVFYLLVFPGVVLHEGSHFLACLLTRTKVSRFAPFSPGRWNDGRFVLGYVRHKRRAFHVGAIMGLAPILLTLWDSYSSPPCSHPSHSKRSLTLQLRLWERKSLQVGF
jgi:hypothetical protein